MKINKQYYRTDLHLTVHVTVITYKMTVKDHKVERFRGVYLLNIMQ